ncbi:MAG: HlyD family efflux transporter periplasmic adaptor subunit [Planctomycetia bacterium]|nr:HlyD family efflux transporter periplasmic adaptor subunit [Planctomycetia bacterium]
MDSPLSDARVAGHAEAATVSRRLNRHRSLGDLVAQFVLPALAMGLLCFAGWYVWKTRPVTNEPPPPIEPARSPYADTLAASGIVEAQTDNIAVGSATAGVVVEVLVKVGDAVAPGAPLFRLDDRQLRGELAVKRAAVSESKSLLVRLEAEPRKEKVPVLTAQVNEARAAVIRETDALKRTEELIVRKVATEQELVTRRESLAAAQAALERTKADLNLLEAGSWEYDRDVARATVSRAEADVEKIEIEIDRLTVRSLVRGRVLQVNVRPGEFVGAPPGQPLVILGDVQTLHVRVDIDEFDIPRFGEEGRASAVPRGNLQQRYPLTFVRVEPFVVPKKSLTGDNTERVDTRVLQVIYALDPAGRPPIYVGSPPAPHPRTLTAAGRAALQGETRLAPVPPGWDSLRPHAATIYPRSCRGAPSPFRVGGRGRVRARGAVAGSRFRR